MKNIFLMLTLLSFAYGASITEARNTKLHLRCVAEGENFFSKGSERGLPTKTDFDFFYEGGKRPQLLKLSGKMLYSLEPLPSDAFEEDFFGGAVFEAEKLKVDLKFQPTEKFQGFVRFRMESKRGMGEEEWAKADLLFKEKTNEASLQIHFDQNGGVVALNCAKEPQ